MPKDFHFSELPFSPWKTPQNEPLKLLKMTFFFLPSAMIYLFPRKSVLQKGV